MPHDFRSLQQLGRPAVPLLSFISVAQLGGKKKKKPWEIVAAFLVALSTKEPKHIARYVLLRGGKVKPGLDWSQLVVRLSKRISHPQGALQCFDLAPSTCIFLTYFLIKVKSALIKFCSVQTQNKKKSTEGWTLLQPHQIFRPSSGGTPCTDLLHWSKFKFCWTFLPFVCFNYGMC